MNKHRAANSTWAPLLLLLVVTIVAQDDLRLDGGEEMGWDTRDWWVQVDGVMGGQSDGSLDFDDNNSMVFTGDIVLDGGGFSSVRKRLDTALDLSGYAGIVVELETSRGFPTTVGNTGAPLGLHLEFNDQSSRYGHASAFAMPLTSEAGTETSIFLPLESFDRASRFGWVCRQAACVLDSTSIDAIEFSVLFQEGTFEVRLKSITAVAEPISFPSPVIDISSDQDLRNLITDTIFSGGALYDYGYGELCIATYRSTVNSILAASGTTVTETMKSMACQGLERADGIVDDKIEVAWTLRGTLDSILEDLGGTDSGAMSNGWRPTTSTAWSNLCVAVTSFPPVNVQGLENGDTIGMNPATIVPEPPTNDVADGTESNLDSQLETSGRPATMNPQQFLSSNKSDNDSSVNIGLVVGIVIAIVLVLGVVTACIVRSKRARNAGKQEEVQDTVVGEQGSHSAASASTTTEVL